MKGLLIARAVAAAQLIVVVAGCGGGSDHPDALAREITRSIDQSASIRKERVGALNITLTTTQRTAALSASNRKDATFGDGPGWSLELHRWVCADETPLRQCGRGAGVAVRYGLLASAIDPASLRVSAPDVETGEEGYAIELACAASQDRSCISVLGIGGFGGYKSCADRSCDAFDAEAEVAAIDLEEMLAADGSVVLACPDKKACSIIAEQLRKLADIAAERTHIEDANEMEKTVTRIARASEGSVFVEDPADGWVSIIAGNSLSTAERAAYRSDELRLDPDGRLHVELGVCGAATAEGCTPDAWKTKISHIALDQVDPTRTLIFDYERLNNKGDVIEYEGAEVLSGCRGGPRKAVYELDLCIENEGVEATGLQVFFPCKDPKSCAAAAADFAGIASFGATPGFERWRETRMSEAFAATDIRNWKQARQATDRLAKGFSGTGYEFAVDDEGATSIAHPVDARIVDEQFLLIRAELCPKGEACPRGGEADEMAVSINLLRAAGETLRIREFAAEGVGPAPWAECRYGDLCIGIEHRGSTFSLGGAPVMCGKPGECEAAARDLRGLIAFVAAQPEPGTPDRRPRTNAEKFAVLVNEQAAGGVSIVALSEGWLSSRFHRARAEKDRVTVALKSCSYAASPACDGEEAWDDTVQSFSLESLDSETTEVFANGADGAELGQLDEFPAASTANAGGYELEIYCRDNAACVSQNGLKSEVVYIPCPTREACYAIRTELAALAGGDKTDAKARRDSATPGAADKKRNAEAQVDVLNAATSGAEILIAVAEPRVLRVMKGAGATLDDKAQLVIRRRVCVALIAVEFGKGNECRPDTLYRDYDLVVDAAALDPGSIDVRAGTASAGEDGAWISAACKPQFACAALKTPERPTHLRLETEMLMRSFIETASAPKIRIPCSGIAACEKGAEALTALTRNPPQSASGKKARAKDTLVGVWEFESPFPNGWVTEFRANGEFVFTNANSRTEGKYVARDGQWSQTAPQFNFNDSGTYRFLDDDTLELTGKYGVSVWKRRKDK